MTEEKKAPVSEAKEAVSPDTITNKEGKTISADSSRTNAMICWLVVAIFGLPIPSFIWMNDENEELRWNAKMTLYFGIAIIVSYILLTIITTIGSLVVVGACCAVIYPVIWLVQVGAGIMGAIKANKGERFEIPVLKDWVK